MDIGRVLPDELEQQVLLELWNLSLSPVERMEIMTVTPLVCRRWMEEFAWLSMRNVVVPSKSYLEYYTKILIDNILPFGCRARFSPVGICRAVTLLAGCRSCMEVMESTFQPVEICAIFDLLRTFQVSTKMLNLKTVRVEPLEDTDLCKLHVSNPFQNIDIKLCKFYVKSNAESMSRMEADEKENAAGYLTYHRWIPAPVCCILMKSRNPTDSGVVLVQCLSRECGIADDRHIELLSSAGSLPKDCIVLCGPLDASNQNILRSEGSDDNQLPQRQSEVHVDSQVIGFVLQFRPSTIQSEERPHEENRVPRVLRFHRKLA